MAIQRKVCSVVLFITAGVLFIYAVWALTYNISYIGDLINSGQLTFAGNEYDIINFYMESCAQYFVYSFLLTASGLLLQKGKVVLHENDTQADANTHEVIDNELNS